jgi:hypothetical protein
LADVSEVAANVYMIDARLYSLPQWGSVFLIDEEKKALVDCGPSSSASYVLDGIRAAGVRPADIDYVIVAQALTELGPLKVTTALYDYIADIDLALVAAGHAKYYRENGIAKKLEAR